MRILTVSNRLPNKLVERNGQWETVKAVSGLVTGVDSVMKETNGVWLGWFGGDYDTYLQNYDKLQEWKKEGYLPIGIPTDAQKRFYEGFNTDVLWAVFHNFPNYMKFRREDWESYVEVNKLFCHRIIEEYKAGDIIWIHDFQLMLLPKMLKQKIPGVKVGFFLHICFPTSDIFETIPTGKELLEGVLEADLIQFHTPSHVKNFNRSLHRYGLRAKGVVEANPIGIDPSFFEKALENDTIKGKATEIKEIFRGRDIILATERLDYMKGIKERLDAYDYMLRTYPEIRKKVVLIQIAVSSRGGVATYQRIAKEVDEAVGNINGTYGTLDWTPVYYTNNSWSQEDLAALYSVSKVACITPLIDGMNLVCREYTVSGDNDRALILSKFAGSALELDEAYIVNPYDVENVGDTMYQALRMPNVEKLKEKVKANTAFDWGNRFLESING